MRRLVRWLAPDAMPAAVMEAPNVALTANVSSDGSGLILTVFNLCADRLDTLRLDVAPDWRDAGVEWLDNATWHRAPATWHEGVLEVALPFELLKARILRLTKTAKR